MSTWFIYVVHGHANGILDHSDLYIPLIYNSVPSHRDWFDPKNPFETLFSSIAQDKNCSHISLASDYDLLHLHMTLYNIILLTYEAGPTPEVLPGNSTDNSLILVPSSASFVRFLLFSCLISYLCCRNVNIPWLLLSYFAFIFVYEGCSPKIFSLVSTTHRIFSNL